MFSFGAVLSLFSLSSRPLSLSRSLAHSLCDLQIKSSFRKLARLHHPDKAGKTRASGEKGSSRDFILVRLAYEILSDPERRRSIDVGGSILSDSMAVGAVAEVDLGANRLIEKSIHPSILPSIHPSNNQSIKADLLEASPPNPIPSPPPLPLVLSPLPHEPARAHRIEPIPH